jgi:hypothetical protein
MLCRSNGIDECQADCEKDERCGCAYFRINDRPDVSWSSAWCALTTVACDNTTTGAVYDATRTHFAIHKCKYNPLPEAVAAWVDKPLYWVDWYGTWDYVCETRLPYPHLRKNTFCGPDCVLAGAPTTLCVPLCISRVFFLIIATWVARHL